MTRAVKWMSLAIVTVAGGNLSGVDTPLIDRVEEDWELVIREPSLEDEAPQVLNVISPNGTQDNDFFVFEINHVTQPDYHAGGLQLQHWNGETVQSWTPVSDTDRLKYANETITYTLRLRLIGGYLFASVRNGESQTWGEFGGDPLKISYPAYQLGLNSYSTANSVAKSRVGFASYRVGRFVLKEVRYYSNGNLAATDTTDYVVHEYQP